MKRLALLLLVLLPAPARAWRYFGYAADPITAAADLVSLIAADAPPPLSFQQPGDWKLVVKPAYFMISDLVDETEGAGSRFRGSRLRGFGASATFGWALDSRWQLFAMLNGARMSGRAIGRYGTAATPVSRVPDDLVEMDGVNEVYSGSAGAGFELASGSGRRWSFPIFAGAYLQGYRTEMTLAPRAGVTNAPSQYLRIHGSGLVPGLSAGAQASRRLGKSFQVDAYTMVGLLLARPKARYTITREDAVGAGALPVGQSEEDSFGERVIPTIGLHVTYRPWDLGVSLGGLLTSAYSRELYRGLKVTKVSISKSFGSSAD